MASSSRRMKSWVRSKWEAVLVIMLICVLVPQFYSVMNFNSKSKRHNKKSPHSEHLHFGSPVDEPEKDAESTYDNYDPDKAMQELKAIWDEFPKSPVETPEPAVRERGKLAEIMNEEKTEEIEIVKSEPDVEYQEVPLKTTEEPKVKEAIVKVDEKWLNIEVGTNEELFEMSRKRDLFEIPNPDFIYHNKLPKCGSTTMHAVLGVLSRWNNFRYLKLEPSLVKFFDGEKMAGLINTLLEREKLTRPFFIFKHHYYFNATQYGLETPTWINVIRDPLTWFESNFYFKRFGWERQPGSRRREDQDLTIDECVKTNHEDCQRVKWKYNQFLCGNAPVCTGHADVEKRKASELAKLNIANNFYLIGILEQFIDTLHLFEKLMPKFYSRAVEAMESDVVQRTINATKTQHKTPMSDESKHYFRTGPLRYETDVYEFAKAIFNEKMKKAEVETYVKPSK